MSDNIYKDNGYENRDDYLHSLAEDMGIDYDVVKAFADTLGPNEDFDGLVTELEDLSDVGLFDDF